MRDASKFIFDSSEGCIQHPDNPFRLHSSQGYNRYIHPFSLRLRSHPSSPSLNRRQRQNGLKAQRS